MATNDQSAHAARVEAALRNLRTDAATGEVVAALAAAGVSSLVLKGPTLREWYPSDAARVYHDGDIWVRPSAIELARETLGRLGFTPALEDRDLPHWWDQHAISWERDADRAAVDLHRALDGVGVAPERAWDLLWAQSVPFEIGGRPGRRLSEPGRILHVLLHSAQHGLADPKATAHVMAAVRAADREAWVAAVRLVEELDALDPFVAGMRAVPAGAALADELGLTAGGSVRVALLAAGAPPISLGLMQLSAASGWRARAALLAGKIAPPPTLLRVWWPPAGRSRLMLAVGYLYRPLWLARRAPAGLRAWRGAERAAGRRE